MTTVVVDPERLVYHIQDKLTSVHGLDRVSRVDAETSGARPCSECYLSLGDGRIPAEQRPPNVPV